MTRSVNEDTIARAGVGHEFKGANHFQDAWSEEFRETRWLKHTGS